MTDLFDRELFIDMSIDVLDDLIEQLAFKTFLHRGAGDFFILFEVILQDLEQDLLDPDLGNQTLIDDREPLRQRDLFVFAGIQITDLIAGTL